MDNHIPFVHDICHGCLLIQQCLGIYGEKKHHRLSFPPDAIHPFQPDHSVSLLQYSAGSLPDVLIPCYAGRNPPFDCDNDIGSLLQRCRQMDQSIWIHNPYRGDSQNCDNHVPFPCNGGS
ncbi:hypothetical protein SDC9_73999 [bioreactor metagenome]|uniref:Uncharacterized protein n=1 Tax=bioreactor metagenome TaxID=1076179 RepID=A0A644YHL6_9ZZZZ